MYIFMYNPFASMEVQNMHLAVQLGSTVASPPCTCQCTCRLYIQLYNQVVQGDSVLKIFQKGIYVPSDLKNKRIALLGTLKDLIFLGPDGAFVVAAYDVVCRPQKKAARLRRAFRALPAWAPLICEIRNTAARTRIRACFCFWVFNIFFLFA